MQIPIVSETRRLSAHATQRELVRASLRYVPPAKSPQIPERDVVARARRWGR
jgi:hypothetical protein